MKWLNNILILVLLSLNNTAIAQIAPVSIAGNLTVSNSIVDNDQKYDQFGPSVVLTYSAVRGDVVPAGTGNQAILGTTEYKDHVAFTKSAFSYYLSPVADFMNAGSESVGVPVNDINGNPRVYNGQIDIGAVEYSMIFNRGDGSWGNLNRWNVSRVPTEYDVVTVLDAVMVSASDAVCKSIIEIGSSGKITIDTASQLEVKTTINNTDANKIHIKASQDSPNGTLIFRNPTSFPVSATVEMYSMAYIDENLEDDDQGKFNWQYFGIPMRSLSALPPDGEWWVRKLNETSTEYDKWEFLTANDMLSSFRGYEVVQAEERIYTFKGVLENRDTTLVLTKSAVPFYAGQHVLSNPYTAAVNISDMVFGDNTEATVYVYNSGSYADWNADQGNGRLGTGRGQYLAVPQNAAPIIYPEIPSMQGFIVKATTGNGSVTIPYVSATKNVSQQRVKSAYLFPHLTVELQSQHSFDRVWLLYEPTASKHFDNGWDGYKIMNKDKTAAMIYANEPAGNLQVNTVSDFNNMYLHFVPGKDDSYTLKIANNNIDEVYPSLYLIDLHEQKTLPIASDTTRYNFSTTNLDYSNNRFRIVTDLDASNGVLEKIKI
jgi:hypothetical protein